MTENKKKEYISFKISDNIYHRQTMVFIGGSQKDFEKEYKRVFSVKSLPNISIYKDWFDGSDLTSSGRTIFDSNVVIVFLPADYEGDVVVHELFHAVEYHFDKIGLHHSNDSSEAWAYYIQFLLRSFNENVDKVK